MAQARLACEALGLAEGIEFRTLSVYDVADLGERFDLVIFMGVLYHLRHPLLALDLIREHVAGDMLLFQTMQRGSDEMIDVPENHPFHLDGTFQPSPIFDDPAYPKMHFIERRYADDWSNWWAPNRACSEAMLRAAGFMIEQRPEAEVYLCRLRADTLCRLGWADGGLSGDWIERWERPHDRSGDDLERAKQQVALGSCHSTPTGQSMPNTVIRAGSRHLCGEPHRNACAGRNVADRRALA